MKKVLFLILAIALCAPVSAQRRGHATRKAKQTETWWKTTDRSNFNLIQVGYACEGYGDGFFVGYKHGWNITGQKLPLYIEPGVEYRYDSWGGGSWDMALTVPVDFSYKFKFGDFSISPITGPTLGYVYNHNLNVKENAFTLGWDFGGRVAYKKITLEYRYNKGLLNNSTVWSTHQIGVGFLF